MARGLEPDQCYYIQNEDVVWDKEQIDLNEDPPPDLVVEIDVTSSSIDHLFLYASLGIPEVWRYDGKSFNHLSVGSNEYAESRGFSDFSFSVEVEMLRFLELKKTTKEKL